MNDSASFSLRKRYRRLAAVLPVAASIVLSTASPAAAVGNTGLGTGGTGQEDDIVYGEDYGTTENPFCMEVTASEYSATITGVYSADDGTARTYSGPATVTFETTENYFIGPEGTYAEATMQDGCDESTLGALDPIAVSVSVSGGNTTNGIVCGPDPGTYYRAFDAITVEWTGDCTVYQSGVSATTPSNLDHGFLATLNPCFNPPDTCTESTITAASWEYPYP